MVGFGHIFFKVEIIFLKITWKKKFETVIIFYFKK